MTCEQDQACGEQYSGDVKSVLLTEEQIRAKTQELGAAIGEKYRDIEGDLLLVTVLKGAVMFVSDLARAIPIPTQMEFMAVSSYGSATSSSGVVRILKDLDRDIQNLDVLIVEDIIDSGLTLSWLMRNLASRGPRSLNVVSLLRKPEAKKVDVDVALVGFEIPNEFVVGYGLDYGERYRDLPLYRHPAPTGLHRLAQLPRNGDRRADGVLTGLDGWSTRGPQHGELGPRMRRGSTAGLIDAQHLAQCSARESGILLGPGLGIGKCPLACQCGERGAVLQVEAHSGQLRCLASRGDGLVQHIGDLREVPDGDPHRVVSGIARDPVAIELWVHRHPRGANIVGGHAGVDHRVDHRARLGLHVGHHPGDAAGPHRHPDGRHEYVGTAAGLAMADNRDVAHGLVEFPDDAHLEGHRLLTGLQRWGE